MNTQMQDVIVSAAIKTCYVKEDVTYSDELFLVVAKRYLKDHGYLPELWIEYIKSRLAEHKLQLATEK